MRAGCVVEHVASALETSLVLALADVEADRHALQRVRRGDDLAAPRCLAARVKREHACRQVELLEPLTRVAVSKLLALLTKSQVDARKRDPLLL